MLARQWNDPYPISFFCYVHAKRQEYEVFGENFLLYMKHKCQCIFTLMTELIKATVCVSEKDDSVNCTQDLTYL